MNQTACFVCSVGGSQDPYDRAYLDLESSCDVYSCKWFLALLVAVIHGGGWGLLVREEAHPRDMDNEDADTMTVG